MTCSFCGKNVTEFRSKFKKLSNNKTKSEKAASAFSETPTHEISEFSEQERELLGSDKVYTPNNSLSMHFRCEHNKSQRFQSTFYQKMRDDLFVFHGNEATMISTAAHHSCLFFAEPFSV